VAGRDDKPPAGAIIVTALRGRWQGPGCRIADRSLARPQPIQPLTTPSPSPRQPAGRARSGAAETIGREGGWPGIPRPAAATWRPGRPGGWHPAEAPGRRIHPPADSGYSAPPIHSP